MPPEFGQTQFAAGPFTIAVPLTDGQEGPPGRAIMLSCSVAGTVVLDLLTGGSITVNPRAAVADPTTNSTTLDNIYPFSVSKFTAGTATIDAAYNVS